MSETYDIDAFSELNRYSAAIIPQNEQYKKDSGIENPDSARNAQNRVAKRQSATIEELGALADLLPYEELGLEIVQIEKEIDGLQAQLEAVDQTPSLEKIAVLALANKLATEAYPASRSIQEAIELNTSARIDQANKQTKDRLQERIGELGLDMGKLLLVFEVAGQPWPVAMAKTIENPNKPDSIRHFPRNGNQPDIIEVSDDIDTIPEAPEENDHDTTAELTRFQERHIDEPKASALIAFYLLYNAGRSITVDELVEFLYTHGDENDKRCPHKLRSRVTTPLGPKVNGKRIATMLENDHHALQYGWRKTLVERADGKRQMSKRRIYRATPIIEVDGDLPELIEIEDELTPTPTEKLAA